MNTAEIERESVEILNETLDALVRAKLTGTEWAIIMFMLRKIGCKQEESVSLSQFLHTIPVSRPTICTAIKTLLLVKILLLVKKGNTKGACNCYAFNSNPRIWQLVKKTARKKKVTKEKHRIANKRKKTNTNTRTCISAVNGVSTSTGTDTVYSISMFAEFWSTFPNWEHRKSKKKQCEAKFSRFSLETQKKVIVALKNMLRILVKENKQSYIQMTTTFLNDWERWLPEDGDKETQGWSE